MMRQRTGWLWNGIHDGHDRRDVFVFQDGDAWSVEELIGGDGGGSKVITAVNEADAAAISRQFTRTAGTWHDMRSRTGTE